MHFIDSVSVARSADRAEGSLFVDPAADYLRDHFPGAPMLQGLLMLEASVQTAAALWRARSGAGVEPDAVLARLDRLQIVRRVLPGDTLVVDVEYADGATPAAPRFIAHGRVGGETAMKARFEMKTSAGTAGAIEGEDT
ncbi:MAG: hypothetical protein ACRD1V_20255 [Vicinamibacterales bacterium]